MKRIEVRAGSKRYRIIIGRGILGELCRNTNFLSADKISVIVSSRVYKLHWDLISEALGTDDRVSTIIMKDGEKNKNYSAAEGFFERLIKEWLSRKSLVIGIGGGVVGDFAGYISALYMRGIKFINVPTTLLSMVDSSIGGKTAVNLGVGKNMIGAFHQPSGVYSDMDFLKTLPASEYRNGLAEILKHGFIGDSDTLNLLRSISPQDVYRDDVMERLVFLSARFKSSVVSGDEKEEGRRAILNFGHTIGHAIESSMNYRGISHGDAVLAGMMAAASISEITGLMTADESSDIRDLIERFGAGAHRIAISPETILDHMKYDKKNFSGRINFVLLKGLGKPVINQNVDFDAIKFAVRSLK